MRPRRMLRRPRSNSAWPVWRLTLANSDPTAPLKDKDGKIPTGLTTPIGGSFGPRRKCLADDLRRAGVVHDLAWPGALLWRPGAQEERALRDGTMHVHHRNGHDPLVRLWLQSGFS